eukprot:7235602-Prymnesium_polylepis.2
MADGRKAAGARSINRMEQQHLAADGARVARCNHPPVGLALVGRLEAEGELREPRHAHADQCGGATALLLLARQEQEAGGAIRSAVSTVALLALAAHEMEVQKVFALQALQHVPQGNLVVGQPHQRAQPRLEQPGPPCALARKQRKIVRRDVTYSVWQRRKRRVCIPRREWAFPKVDGKVEAVALVLGLHHRVEPRRAEGHRRVNLQRQIEGRRG